MSRAPNGFRQTGVTRRGVLVGTAAAGAALVAGAYLGRNIFYRAVAGYLADGAMPGGAESDPAVWFEITADDRVRLTVPKVEMGQGAHTALAQIAADELGAGWDRIEVLQGDTVAGPDDGSGTVGSASVSGLYEPLRLAAATLRETLRLRGSELLGLPGEALAVTGNRVAASDGATSLSFGDIVARTNEWPGIGREPVLKSSGEFEYIGRSMPRVDLDAKIRGRAVYGFDARVDGMLYGAVARPPAIGSRMIAARAGTAASGPGVVDVVIDIESGFAGVVAETRVQAQQAVNGLDIEWQRDEEWSLERIEALLDTSAGVGVPIQKRGDAEREIGDEPTLTAEYATPFAAHAQLEPQAALAVPLADGLELHISTQMASYAQAAIAAALDMPEREIVVRPAYLGGGFGRKTGVEPGIEAARLARAVERPVHVGWTRTEEMRDGFYRPPTRNRFSARLADGQIRALGHYHASGEVLFGFLPGALTHVVGADPGAWRGAYSFYDGIDHHLLSTQTARLPVATGSWRGLGLFPNTFATESFIDEMAHAAGIDPLQFRLRHLGDSETSARFRAVLETVAALAGYGGSLPPGHAQGIACCIDVGTVVAMCVELSLEDGEIVVHRAVQAIDAGRIVSPDGALAQAQGSIVMGLGSTLIEELAIEDGAIAARNFDRYPLITIDRIPEIDIRFLDSDRPPSGMGEPAIGPVGAAVGNALYNVAGIRLRTLPFTAERVRTALADL